MARFGVGQPANRLEDRRFLTGNGRYTDDIPLPGALYAAFVRSPYPHARIAAIDTATAETSPGVVFVLTGQMLYDLGVGPLPCNYRPPQPDGMPAFIPDRYPLARDRVRHVGDPVAMVVAERLDAAADAAEAVEVEYEPLPHVTDPIAAAGADMHIADRDAHLWPEHGSFTAFRWEKGDRAATEAAFASAHHVTGLDLENNRVSANPLEGRTAAADYESGTGRLTIYLACQGAHNMRRALAEGVLRIPQEDLRVVVPDVGGGFGMKIFPYPEYACLLIAARALKRPVRWSASRTESFISDAHGRDIRSRAELALADNGRFLGVRVRTIANLGAYVSSAAPLVVTNAGGGLLTGVYDIPAAHVSVQAVFTNTNPVDAYRGAGRPESAYIIERLVDHAARKLGLAPIELRHRNLVPAKAMPYRNAFGLTYDSGDFPTILDRAERTFLSNEARAERQASARARDQLHGTGFAFYIEACAGPNEDAGSIRVHRNGTVEVLAGTQSNGQGHETAFVQLVCDALGVHPDAVTYVQGDTDRIATGKGTAGSRSLGVGAMAMLGAARDAADALKSAAADALEAAVADIVVTQDGYAIAGTDRTIGFRQTVAAYAQGRNETGPVILETTRSFKPAQHTFPNGVHVCEVEIDPETGVVSVAAYGIVDDFGTVVNPKLLAGQIDGGVAQGLGQALMEHVIFDNESGQLLTGSFMDYAMPCADLGPAPQLILEGFPTELNPLGVKGAGEAGAIGAPPAVMNAVLDALAPLGVETLDMPATPERVWRAIRAAGGP